MATSRLAQTSELGGVTTNDGRSRAWLADLHRPLSSEGLRHYGRGLAGQFSILHRPLSSEGLRHSDIDDAVMFPLHRPLSSEGLRPSPMPFTRRATLAQTSELGGVTTGGGERFIRLIFLHRPLSSEGLRRFGELLSISVTFLAQTSELGGVTTAHPFPLQSRGMLAQTSELGGVTT